MTVMMVLVALFLAGGILIKDFALALMMGLVVGTYSSVFVASPIVYIWPKQKKSIQSTVHPKRKPSLSTGMSIRTKKGAVV
jgi:preprotein translocase subunit SecF